MRRTVQWASTASLGVGLAGIYWWARRNPHRGLPRRRAARVVFMCGPAGSGTSTYARGLEAQGFVKLSTDQEAWDRGYRSMPLPDDVQRDIHAHLRHRLHTAVREGRDVVLDLSFWSRAAREEWRAEVAADGIVAETVYLATDRATCLARVRARALQHGDDFTLDPDLAARYWDGFEVPSADEGPLTVVGAGD